jgi:hypothetical protein
MTLQRKVLDLKLRAALAAKHAHFWQRAIDTHGEEKATAFYTHLGLNHLEQKSFEWEGLTLSREPKEHEKIAVKGIHNAQESARESIGTVLLRLRADLITDGLSRIKKLRPAHYHELVLQAPGELRIDLSDKLVNVHRQGRMLVAAELSMKATVIDDGDFDELDDLVDLTTSRVTNDVQSRLIDAAARHALLGQSGINLITIVANELSTGSVTYIDRAARGLANRVINIGRSDEAQSRSDEWDKIVYSALLDLNTCPACASADGEESEDGSGLEPVPNPSCDGGDYCRCFWVYVFERITN